MGQNSNSPAIIENTYGGELPRGATNLRIAVSGCIPDFKGYTVIITTARGKVLTSLDHAGVRNLVSEFSMEDLRENPEETWNMLVAEMRTALEVHYAARAEELCDVCHTYRIPREGYRICKCLCGLQTYGIGYYPGTREVVPAHPSNEGSDFYRREDVDNILRQLPEELLTTLRVRTPAGDAAK